MKIAITLVAACVVFAGCAATQDVTTKTQLNTAQRQAVEAIKSNFRTVCHQVNYDTPQSTVARPGQIKMMDSANITRLFESSTGWYRAQVHAQGMVDNVYYHPGTRRTVCGQKNWDTYSNTSGMPFTEVGAEAKRTL